MQEMHDLAHSLDPTRVTGFRRCDFAADIPRGLLAQQLRRLVQRPLHRAPKVSQTWRAKNLHLIHIERVPTLTLAATPKTPTRTSCGTSPPGKAPQETGLAYRDASLAASPRISRDGDWSETYACDLSTGTLKTQETLDWFTGSGPAWIFKDFTTPLARKILSPRIEPERRSRARPHAERKLLRLPVLLTDEKPAPDGLRPRPYMARPLGQTRTSHAPSASTPTAPPPNFFSTATHSA